MGKFGRKIDLSVKTNFENDHAWNNYLRNEQQRNSIKNAHMSRSPFVCFTNSPLTLQNFAAEI